MTAAVAFAVAGAAGATTVVSGSYQLQDGSFGTGLGVHSNGTQSGNTLNAHVNQDGSAVTFTSTDTLSQTGSGEATIDGPFGNLDVNFAKSWDAITFAFSLPNGHGAPTSSQMEIFINGSSTAAFDTSNCLVLCDLGNHGEQKFIVSGLGGASIDELKFEFSNPIDNGKQFRVMGGVPEPTAWSMMLLGFFSAGALLRGRRKTAQAHLG